MSNYREDHYFRTCCLSAARSSVRPSVPTFQNLAKQNNLQAIIVIATGGNVGLAEWIIDGTHVLHVLLVITLQKSFFNQPKKEVLEKNYMLF